MGTVSVTLPSDGQTADASDYNTPITTVVNEINGNLDNANIKSGAAIAGSKLADASIDIGTKASAFDGWVSVTDSWAYASATTITVPTDATTKYSVGDKIKIVQSASTKYFYITAVAATVLTVNGGSDYTVANSAISGIYYSKVTTPLGFPQWFNYTPTWTNVTKGSATIVSRFAMNGKTIDYRIEFTWAGDTSASGNFTYSLPVASSSSGYAVRKSIGSALLFDTSGGATNQSITRWASTTTGDIVYLSTTTQTATSATAPWTWAVGDQMLVEGSYEAA